jgi:hydrogenase expression/formation protein HypC
MCLAVPMRVVEIEGRYASVEHGGLVRRVRIDFLPNARVGEYVLVHAGIAIERISPEEAEKTLSMIKALVDEVH